MADITSILASSYRSNVLSTAQSKTKYVPVDPSLYQGTWTGSYPGNKQFSITVSDVSGFRGQVKYQSQGTVKYQQVLIKDNSFRFGDTRFTLTKVGQAQVKNVVTDPATGSTYLDTAVATLKS